MTTVDLSFNPLPVCETRQVTALVLPQGPADVTLEEVYLGTIALSLEGS